MTRPAVVRSLSHQPPPPPQLLARARRPLSCTAAHAAAVVAAAAAAAAGPNGTPGSAAADTTTATGTAPTKAPDVTSGTSQVRIVEVGARDGLQNEPGTVGLVTKLQLLARLRATGLCHIEAGAFVSPRWVPQMAESPSILQHLGAARASTRASASASASASGEGQGDGQEDDGTTYSWLVPNEQGLTAMLSAAAQPQLSAPASVRGHEIAIFASASEGFSRRNLNCSVAESLARFEPVAARARELGLRVRGYVSMVVACPYDGPTPPAAVGDAVQRLLAMGCYEVSLGDTTGVGTPASVAALLRHLTVDRAIPARRLAAHWHDTFGMAVVNARVALDFGIRTFDSSVAGLGGCPYAVGATGNVATEDLVYFLEGCGLRTGVDLDALVAVGQWISHALGRRNASRVGRALASRHRGAGGSGDGGGGGGGDVSAGKL